MHYNRSKNIMGVIKGSFRLINNKITFERTKINFLFNDENRKANNNAKKKKKAFLLFMNIQKFIIAKKKNNNRNDMQKYKFLIINVRVYMQQILHFCKLYAF